MWFQISSMTGNYGAALDVFTDCERDAGEQCQRKGPGGPSQCQVEQESAVPWQAGHPALSCSALG